MELIIKESQNIGLSINKDIYFNITKYEYLKSINTKEKMFEWLIYNDTMFSSLYRLSKEELNVIYLYVTNKISFKISFNILKNRLCNINIINYTMLLNRINNYSKKYNSLSSKTITKITIVCNKQNLLKILSLDLNKKNITLENDDITFKDFYDLLTGIDLKKYDDLGVKIKIVESSKPITLSRLYNIVSITKAVAEKIDGMNLSNFEKIIYIYDIVKEKIYKKDKNNSWVCRDIDDVILGDYIVCMGYTRRINVQSSFHNIESIMLCSKKENHAINLIYIKDEKYNIDGFLTFDATNDSRKNEEDKDYLNNYNYFGNNVGSTNKKMSIEELQEINVPLDELSKKFKNYNTDDELKYINVIEELFRMSGNNNHEELVNKIIFYDHLSSKEKRELQKEYKELINKLFNTSIDMSTFIRALYNTRRIEYYIDMIPEINIDNIRDSSVNWKMFHTNEELGEDKIKRFLFRLGANLYLDEKEEKLISSSLKDNPSTERDILNMRLVKVLKRSLNIKSDNNPNVHS